MLRVAIAGFGTVGRSVAKILCSRAPAGLALTRIYNRDIQRKIVHWVPSDVQWTDRLDDLLDDEIDIVVELIGGTTTAEDVIRRALLAGKSVVTANKQVVARSGPELLDLAERQQRQLRFEAAVCAGVPVLRAIEEGLAADSLSRIGGVLNGTCNYILTRMEASGVSFAEALKEAQTKGFAEADPTDDVDGMDARAKLAILAMVGLRCRVQATDIPCRSIARIEAADFSFARRLDCTIRQVAWAERDPQDEGSILASVGPALVPLASPFAQVHGPNNVVTIRGEIGGETTFSGPGAGGDPTAVAVVSDLIALARGTGPSFDSRVTQTICRVGLPDFPLAPPPLSLPMVVGAAKAAPLRTADVRDLEGTEIVVPASVSNLGPGFDTLSVAVQLYLTVRVREVDARGKNQTAFEFRGQQLEGENYIARSFWELVGRHPIDVPSLRLEVRSDIPMRAGLGSSAAATVAGLKLHELLAGPRAPAELLTIASRLEGHPDNAAAALHGGLVGSWQQEDGTVRAYSRRWPESIRFVIAMPAVRLETAVARRVLPDAIPRADAVFNLQRVALLLETLERGDYRNLKEALRDRWHQPFREALVPGLEEALALDHPDLLGVCLSGSGPSIVALAERNFPAIESLLLKIYERLSIPCKVRTLSAHQP